MQRGVQAANGEEVEEIPRSWRNRKDFNDLLRLPCAARLPSSFVSWLKRERERQTRNIFGRNNLEESGERRGESSRPVARVR